MGTKIRLRSESNNGRLYIRFVFMPDDRASFPMNSEMPYSTDEGVFDWLQINYQDDIDAVKARSTDIFGRLFRGADRNSMLHDIKAPLIIDDHLLRTDPVPWEALYGGNSFLGIKYPIYRYRSVDNKEPLRLRSFLLLADPDESLEKAHEHADNLVESLFKYDCDCKLLIGSQITPSEIRNNIRRAFVTGEYDVIYYAGHFRSDKHGIYIPLTNGNKIRPEDIKDEIQGDYNPLVFFNACLSAASTGPDPLSNFVKLFFDFAGPRVSAFIGTNNFVINESGFWLAEKFFYTLLLNGDVGEALRAAREKTQQEYPLDAAWCSYVLYGEPLPVPPPPSKEELLWKKAVGLYKRRNYDEAQTTCNELKNHLRNEFDQSRRETQ